MDQSPSSLPKESHETAQSSAEQTTNETKESLQQLRRETESRRSSEKLTEGPNGVLYQGSVPWQVLPRGAAVPVTLTPEAKRDLEAEYARTQGAGNDQLVVEALAEIDRKLQGGVDLGRAYVVFEQDAQRGLLVGESGSGPLGWVQRDGVYDWIDRRVLTDDKKSVTGFIVGESEDSYEVIRSTGERFQSVKKSELQHEPRFAYRDSEVSLHYTFVVGLIAALEQMPKDKPLPPDKRENVLSKLRGLWLIDDALRQAVENFKETGNGYSFLLSLRTYLLDIGSKATIEKDLVVRDHKFGGDSKESY